MKNRGKRYRQLLEKRGENNILPLPGAIENVLTTTSAKFDETVEISVRLGIDARKAEQQLRGTVSLPHGTGKDVRIIVFAAGEKAKEAEDAGAEHVGGADLVKKIQGGFMDFDIAIATPDMMREVSKLGRVLGPRGLMPNPKVGTVTFEITRAVKECKAGRSEYRNDKGGIIHMAVGKSSFTPQQLTDNINSVLAKLIRSKPSSAKGVYIRSITLSCTMGPGIKVDPSSARDALKGAA